MTESFCTVHDMHRTIAVRLAGQDSVFAFNPDFLQDGAANGVPEQQGASAMEED